jgi:hypothetical protein
MQKIYRLFHSVVIGVKGVKLSPLQSNGTWLEGTLVAPTCHKRFEQIHLSALARTIRMCWLEPGGKLRQSIVVLIVVPGFI